MFQKNSMEVACLNIIRNNIRGNNANVTIIMEKSSFPKGIIFDKILVNTFNKCISKMDLKEANNILGIDNVIKNNKSNDHYININPEEYTFTAVPAFSESDKQILNNFYGEVIF